MYNVNQTHDPDRQSWVESANADDTDFPIQNLPFCVIEQGSDRSIGVGIGDQVLNIKLAAGVGMLSDDLVEAVVQPSMNAIMGMTLKQREKLRREIGDLLDKNTKANRAELEAALVPMALAKYRVPCTIRDYSDFYASVYHATNVGSMFRPDNPLLPNWKHIPIGYHGRASSIVVSGHEVRRPAGQKAPTNDGMIPNVSPSKLLDYELEVGFYVGRGNQLGKTISIENAEDHLFGMTLVNDWSARDLQKWEYQPLGPFLGKSFATTVSPWVVTMEALAPFRCAEFERPEGDPVPLDYLASSENSRNGGVDLNLEVHISTMQMRELGMATEKLSGTSFRNMYWTIAQMLTHHASNGCNLQTGDLMASGTVSGPERSERGCLLELTWNGDANNPLPGTQRSLLTMPTGEERKFLGDEDEVSLFGYCVNEKYRRIGFGECTGIIKPAAE